VIGVSFLREVAEQGRDLINLADYLGTDGQLRINPSSLFGYHLFGYGSLYEKIDNSSFLK
jgi:hypothetical protein